jgi:putative oxidoreductase
MNPANDPRTAYAALLLRVSLGTMFIMHSLWLKLVVFTLPGTAQFFGSIGLPPALAYAVFALEAIGGVALILGVATRPVAHAGNGWLFTNPNGGWEYPLFLTLATAVQALLGGGAWALQGAIRRGPASLARA